MRTDRRIDITKLLVAFRSFANVPKNAREEAVTVSGITLNKLNSEVTGLLRFGVMSSGDLKKANGFFETSGTPPLDINVMSQTECSAEPLREVPTSQNGLRTCLTPV
jgi:hypothetical protein